MALEPVLKQRNKVGYVAARNTRILKDTLTEYFQIKEELIQKYGEQDVSSDGTLLPRISIKPDSAKFQDFMKEFAPIKDIEHEVDLMVLKYDEVVGILSGEEILELEFMLED